MTNRILYKAMHFLTSSATANPPLLQRVRYLAWWMHCPVTGRVKIGCHRESVSAWERYGSSLVWVDQRHGWKNDTFWHETLKRTALSSIIKSWAEFVSGDYYSTNNPLPPLRPFLYTWTLLTNPYPHLLLKLAPFIPDACKSPTPRNSSPSVPSVASLSCYKHARTTSSFPVSYVIIVDVKLGRFIRFTMKRGFIANPRW